MYGDAPFGVAPYASLSVVNIVANDTVFLTNDNSVSLVGTKITNDTVALGEIGGIALVGNINTSRTLTLSEVSDVTTSCGIATVHTLNLDVNSTVTETFGLLFLQTITLSAVSDFSFSYLSASNLFLTITSNSDLSLANLTTLNQSVTASAISSIDISNLFNSSKSLTLTANNNFIVLSGQPYTDGVGLTVNSTLTLLPGFGFSLTLEISAVSDATADFAYVKNSTLTIDAVNDIAFDTLMTQVGRLTVNAIPGVTSGATQAGDRTLAITSNIVLFIENLYDFLYVATAISQVAPVLLYKPGTAELAEAQSGVSVQNQFIAGRTVTDTLTFIETTRCLRTKSHVSDTFALTDLVTILYATSLATSDDITLTDIANAFRGRTDSLTFADSVSVTKSKRLTVTDTLVLTEVLSRKITVNLNVSDTFVFNPPRAIPTTISSERGAYTYVLGDAYAVLKPRKCQVILSVPGATIILPCPIFGDTQNFQGELTLKRTMTGRTYSYIKQTVLEKIEYPFQLWTTKYLELRSFIINNSHKLMTINNWKGEVWLAHMINNPAEFTAAARFQPKGERYDITLQFEGVRIGGI